MPVIGNKRGHQGYFGSVLWKNVAANFAGAAANGTISILGLTQYVRIYGLQNWGHIAALVVFVNLLMLTEVGATQIYISAFNSSSAKGRTFEQYFGLMIALGGCTTVCAILGLVCLSKLGFKGGIIAQGNKQVFVAVAFYFANFLNNFLYAHMSAAQRQLAMNARQTAFLLLKTMGTLAYAYWISTEVSGYFVIFSVIGLLELVTNVLSTKDQEYTFQGVVNGVANALTLFRAISGISIGIVIGILVANLDKIYLSSVSEAAVFAVYSVTFTVAMYFMQLQYPVMRAFFPVIAKLYHGDDTHAKRKVVWLQLLIINVLIVPPLSVAFYFDGYILSVFALDVQTYPDVNLLFRMLLICVYLNSVYHIFYQQMMTSGASGYIVRINIVCLISSGVILLVFGGTYTILSGGFAWLLMCAIQLLGGFIFMSNRWQNVDG